jgi:hypothetical protein
MISRTEIRCISQIHPESHILELKSGASLEPKPIHTTKKIKATEEARLESSGKKARSP